jgi:hypothetical protein
MPQSEDPKSKGGKARAASLSGEERSEIARAGARAKWESSAPVVLLSDKLKLGGVEVDCYVTENGERLIAGRGMQDLLRLVGEEPPRSGQKPGSRMTRLLNNQVLRPLIFKDKPADHFAAKKLRYQAQTISGYNAEMLVDICEGLLDARKQKLLKTVRQETIAAQCELILRGLAKTGIVALIDEATGYQALRPADGLRTYFDQILRKDLAAWLKRFPDEFYENIYKLRNWEWKGMSKNRFSAVAHYTNDLLYERIAAGLREELEVRNPKNEKGQRGHKHHQWLNTEAGEKLFAQQMFAVLMFQRAALNQTGDRWKKFMADMDKFLPRKEPTVPLKGQSYRLPFDDPEPA